MRGRQRGVARAWERIVKKERGKGRAGWEAVDDKEVT